VLQKLKSINSLRSNKMLILMLLLHSNLQLYLGSAPVFCRLLIINIYVIITFTKLPKKEDIWQEENLK